MAWTMGIEIKQNSVYGKRYKLTKQWQRTLCQVSAAGYIKQIVQTDSFGKSKGVFASLVVTEMVRDAVINTNEECCTA